MNFIVTQAPMKKTTSWTNSVALMFIVELGKRAGRAAPAPGN